MSNQLILSLLMTSCGGLLGCRGSSMQGWGRPWSKPVWTSSGQPEVWMGSPAADNVLTRERANLRNVNYTTKMLALLKQHRDAGHSTESSTQTGKQSWLYTV